MTEFSVLETVAREVTFRGEPLKVSPLKIGQIPAFTRAIRPCFAALAGFIASEPSGDGAAGAAKNLEDLGIELDLEKVADLIDQHGDALIEAAAIAIRKKKDEVAELEIDEFISLVRAIIEVNVDFFGRAVAKALNEPKGTGAGLMPSSS